MSPDLLAGRYELTERIAGGGMGQVWRGRDRILERIVAIKTVDLSAQEPTARERFRREAIATAGLSAQNIVQVYDAGVDNTTAYLVMELLSGPTLSQVIHDGGPMRIDDGVNVTLEVARALLTAHKIGIVHRDIKPGNVMYHHDQVKLVDFGIAQLARNLGAALTAPATALGTAAYMSPEQAAGEGATDKSDWYALGCLMTTIFTGQPPFSGDALAVANQQINSKPPFLSERRPEAPPALDRLVAALLAKEPAGRPTGEQVVEQLLQLSGDPNLGTNLLAGAAGADATELYASGGTAVWNESGVGAGATRATYGESPGGPESPSPARPVVPAPPPPPLDSRGGSGKRRPVGPIIAVILLVLVLGLGGAYFLLGRDATPGPVIATPTATPTPSPTSAPTTTRAVPTRAPTTRRPTTQPPTTEPPATSAPLETILPSPGNENGGDGNGNGGNDNDNGNGNGGNGDGDANATP